MFCNVDVTMNGSRRESETGQVVFILLYLGDRDKIFSNRLPNRSMLRHRYGRAIDVQYEVPNL